MFEHIDFTKDFSATEFVEVLQHFKTLDQADTISIWGRIGKNRHNTILLHKMCADQIRNALKLQQKFSSL